jgi:hypothetical protein
MRAVGLVVGMLALAGCQSTQEQSAALAAKAEGAVKEAKQTVGATNTLATVTSTTLVRDANGVAAVVEVRNGRTAQADVPVALSVRHASKVLFRNDAPGLDPSLAAIPSLAAGERVAWVNDQVPAPPEADKGVARLGAARGKAPRELPELAVSDVKIGGDSSGVVVDGKLENRSAVTQRRVVVFCVARKGDRIVAAGRAVVDTLPAAGKGRPAAFSVYVIGDPRHAEITMWAPPTQLGGTR